MVIGRYRGEEDVRRNGGELPRQEDRGGVPDKDRRVSLGVNLTEERDRRRRQLEGELRELDHTIRASDGYRIRSKLNLLEKSYFVFEANYLSLRHILEGFEQRAAFLEPWKEGSRFRLEPFANEVARLFQNYLAAATALSSRIQVLLQEKDATTQYEGANSSLVEYRRAEGSSLHRFVEDLAGYMLQAGFPFALGEVKEFGGEGSVASSAIKLDVGELGRWGQWSEGSREYLEALDDGAKLGEIVNKYAAVVTGSYREFVAWQSELHWEALQELEELQSRRAPLEKKLEYLEELLEVFGETASAMQEEHERLMGEFEEERERLAQELEAERSHRERARVRVEELEAERERLAEELQAASSVAAEGTAAAQEGREKLAKELERLTEELAAERERLAEELEAASSAAAEGTAATQEEGYEKLAKELETERMYHEWATERAEKLEAALERERNKGFLRRLFGR